MSKKKTSFTLNIDLLKDLKMKAVELGTSQTKLLEKFIKQGLKNNEEVNGFINDNSGTLIIDNIKPNLLKKISKIAKNEKITEEEAINELLEKAIETTNNKCFNDKINKISDSNDKIIIQLPRKSGKSLETEEIIGIFEAKEPFDSVEEIKKMESGEDI
ncbi:hypothetical protein KQY27_03405 [Methanobrevibacter sp. TMH8]|uniref:hypothetical protein n=1 Tax=Methanobrevibacter sp. TMH8 TaxID=2848611 RepID=UPI001CCAE631|nr:hypothetical protein [Methanobrevibacter sp. TMH8]MBZ9570592.1 hypothetical protein [Methanobrevibacter sp. TMH8]